MTTLADLCQICTTNFRNPFKCDGNYQARYLLLQTALPMSICRLTSVIHMMQLPKIHCVKSQPHSQAYSQSSSLQGLVLMDSNSKLSVLVVLHPSRWTTAEDWQTQALLGWVLDHIPEARATALLNNTDLKDLIKRASSTEYNQRLPDGHIPVLINKMVDSSASVSESH